ncbi:hypothetical protein HerbRD11066_65540 [Herbidospora sp. RD11066]
MQHPERERRLLLHPRHPEDTQSLGRRDVVEQRRLADPRVAPEDDGPAQSAAQRLGETVETRPFLGPAHDGHGSTSCLKRADQSSIAGVVRDRTGRSVVPLSSCAGI